MKVNHFDGYGEKGPEELLLLSRLKEKLKDFKEFKVRVLDYALGYKDKEASYFVANFDTTLQQTCGDIFRKVKTETVTKKETILFYGKILPRVLRLKELEVTESWGFDDFEE